MELGFKDFHWWGSNCVNFTGIQEHGPKVEFDLDYDTADKFELYCEGAASLNIHADGTMYFTTMEYNRRREEWEQTIEKDVTNDLEFKTSLDNWLRENNLYQSDSFPFPISTRPSFFGSEKIADSLESLLKFVKKLK